MNNLNGKIDQIMTAVIQEQDVEMTIKSLGKLGVPITRLASSGGFLGRRNSTLFIGMNESIREDVVRSLQNSCQQRVEYLAIPLEGSPLPMPTPIPVTVGGATIFTLPVDKYEEF